MGNPVIAIILSLIAYTLLNIGFVLQKKAASALPQVEHQSLWDNVKNFISNKMWVAGLVLTSIPWFLYLFAIDYGSLSLVTPFNGWGIVVLVIFSYFYLKEPISRAELACIGVTVVGVVILGITSPASNFEYTPTTMAAILVTPIAITFIVTMGIFAIVPVLISAKRGFWHADIILGACSGVGAAIGAIFSNAMMAYIATGDLWSSLGVALGALAFWFYLLMAAVGNTASMVYQQIAYQKGKASLVAPLYTIVSLVLPVIGGIVIFGEWSLVSPEFAVLRAASIILITMGAAALSYFNSKYALQKSPEPLKREPTSVKTPISPETNDQS